MATATFNEFYNEWRSNPHWWFSAKPDDDAYITEKYGHLLHDRKNVTESIKCVIVFDQVPCHVFRNMQDKTKKDALIRVHRDFAISIADSVLQNGIDLNTLDDIDFNFLLLPYRHVGDLSMNMWVAQLAWERLHHPMHSNSKLLRAFIKATYTRAPRDQEGWVSLHAEQAASWDHSKYEDVVEFAPVWPRWDSVSLKEVHLIAETLKYHPWPSSQPIIISLSGGVDSMVIATVLRRLFPERKLHAVHINYCNRREADAEEAFVLAWAAVINIPVYVRRITEIQREQTRDFMRSTYETYTRDVRYSTYSYAAKELGMDKGQAAHVVLGHHEDDAFENILTNIAHCEKFDNLRGMTAVSSAAGPMGPIEFHRPLIRVPKNEIYKAALVLGVPYLQDSTLKTTQRGTIRDVVRPVLEQWDNTIVRRLLDMADIVGEFAGSFEKDVMHAVENTKKGEDGIIRWTTPRSNDVVLSPRFWRRYCQRVLQITPSWRSLDNMKTLVERMIKKSVGTRVMLTSHVEVSMCLWNNSSSAEPFMLFALRRLGHQELKSYQVSKGPSHDRQDTLQ